MVIVLPVGQTICSEDQMLNIKAVSKPFSRIVDGVPFGGLQRIIISGQILGRYVTGPLVVGFKTTSDKHDLVTVTAYEIGKEKAKVQDQLILADVLFTKCVE
jgi:hypothetical protein